MNTSHVSYCHSSQAARDMTLTSGLTNQLCFAHISKINGGQDKRKVDSCIRKHAFRFDLSCSFCEYPFIFHCLHCSPSCFDPYSLLLAYFWLGLSWIDCISANKSFSSSKTSSRKPYTSSKQQERQKHSAETTINFSGSKRQSVSAHRQQPRAVHPVRRVQAHISRRANEDGYKEGGRRREDST